MKKPGKPMIVGRLSESFYLGDLPAITLPEKGLSNLLLVLSVHFGRKDWPPPPDQFKQSK